MLIDNVTVNKNTFVGVPSGDAVVHPSAQCSNITIVGNLPARAPLAILDAANLRLPPRLG